MKIDCIQFCCSFCFNSFAHLLKMFLETAVKCPKFRLMKVSWHVIKNAFLLAVDIENPRHYKYMQLQYPGNLFKRNFISCIDKQVVMHPIFCFISKLKYNLSSVYF